MAWDKDACLLFHIWSFLFKLKIPQGGMSFFASSVLYRVHNSQAAFLVPPYQKSNQLRMLIRETESSLVKTAMFFTSVLVYLLLLSTDVSLKCTI